MAVTLMPGAGLEQNRIPAMLTPHHISALIVLVEEKINSLSVVAMSQSSPQMKTSFVNEISEYDLLRSYLMSARLA